MNWNKISVRLTGLFVVLLMFGAATRPWTWGETSQTNKLEAKPTAIITTPSPTTVVAIEPSPIPQPLLESENFCGNGPIVPYQVQADSEGNFVLSQQNTGGGLLSNKIRALEMTRDGLFVGYVVDENLVSNVSFVTPDSIETCLSDGVSPLGHVNDILYTLAGIWVATDGYGIYRLHEGVWTQSTKEQGLADNRVYDLAIGVDGLLYAGTFEGISVFNIETDSWIDVALHYNTQLVLRKVHALLFQVDETSWIGTIDSGIQFIHNKNVVSYRSDSVVGWPGDLIVVPQMRSNNIRAIRETPWEEVLVAGDPGLAIYSPEEKSWQDLTPSESPTTFGALDVEIDEGWRIWATGPEETFIIHKLENYTVREYWFGGLALELGSKHDVFQNRVAIGTDGVGLFFGDIFEEE